MKRWIRSQGGRRIGGTSLLTKEEDEELLAYIEMLGERGIPYPGSAIRRMVSRFFRSLNRCCLMSCAVIVNQWFLVTELLLILYSFLGAFAVLRTSIRPARQGQRKRTFKVWQALDTYISTRTPDHPK